MNGATSGVSLSESVGRYTSGRSDRTIADADGQLEAREHRHPPQTAIEQRRDEKASRRNADQNHREHDGEPVDRRPQKQRQDPEPDDLERQRHGARDREHAEDDPQAAVAQRSGFRSVRLQPDVAWRCGRHAARAQRHRDRAQADHEIQRRGGEKRSVDAALGNQVEAGGNGADDRARRVAGVERPQPAAERAGPERGRLDDQRQRRAHQRRRNDQHRERHREVHRHEAGR